MESITIKRTAKNVWMKRYDNYETSFRKISQKEALSDIQQAREQKTMFSDCDENKVGVPLMWGYWN